LKIQSKLFDLHRTLNCGQVFRWTLNEDQWWYGVVRDHIIKIRQVQNELEFFIYPKMPEPAKFLSHYFRLDDDLEFIYQQICKDNYMEYAIKNARGLRLIRQEPWECLISYIISQQNNIPKIKRSIESLSRKFGTPYYIQEKIFHIFPTPAQLSEANLDELKRGFKLDGCALGYRAKYVLKSASLIQNESLSFSLEALKNFPYKEACKLLQKTFPGVGPKVADCILLFSADKLEAFPVDTWIRRLISKLYSQKGSIRQIKQFCTEYFGQFAGYAQEYLFFAAKDFANNFKRNQ